MKLLAQPKRMAVLAHLALGGRGRYLQRDELLVRFWPESDLLHARNALNQVLHALRSELGPGVLRTRGRREIGLDPERVWCDVWSFLTAVQEKRYEEALELYAGPLLPGFHCDDGGEFERWLSHERERLQRAASGSVWALAHRHLDRGAVMAAEEAAHHALGMAATDETPVRTFIAALACSGDRAAALRFYDSYCSQLAEELEIEPSEQTARVALLIRAGDSPVQIGRGIAPPDPIADAAAPLWASSSAESGTSPEGEGLGEPWEPSSGGPAESHLVVREIHRASPGPRTWWWVFGALCVLLVLTRFYGSGGHATPGTPPIHPPVSILADAEGSASQEQREAITALLRTGLAESRVLETVPPVEVARTLALMEWPADAPLDGVAARAASDRLGASVVVVPRLDRLGQTYSLAVRVESAESGEVHAGVNGWTTGTTALVRLVDSLVVDLTRRLGEDELDLVQRQPLPSVLTPSLEALQKYEAARRLNAAAQHQAAVSLLTEAVALDTAFAMAWQLMAAIYGNFLDQPDSAALAAANAERFADRLSAARRQDMELHRRMRSDVALWDGAMEVAERAVTRNPDYLNNFAVYTAFEAGLPDSAVSLRFAIERRNAQSARRFDPYAHVATSCWINTHYWAAATDRLHEWSTLLDSLRIAVPPDCAREADLFEHLAAAEWSKALEMLESDPAAWRWPDAVEVASRQITPLRGRLLLAHRTPAPANAEKKTWAKGDWAGVSKLLLEVVYGVTPDETAGEIQLAGRGSQEVRTFLLYGVRQALVGDTTEARRVARRLQAMRDRSTSRLFEAAYEPWFILLETGPRWRNGDWPAVIHRLEPLADRIRNPGVGGPLAGDAYLVWWLLADAHRNLGEPASAIPYLEATLQRPTHGVQDWTLQGYIHPAARFALGGLYAQVGEHQSALEQYRAFLSTFTDADPGVRWMVEKARQAVGATPR